MLFEDRRDAGRQLGLALSGEAGPDVLVLGLARGGLVVAAEVALALGAPLAVILTRKVGAPGNPEYALGAVAEAGAVVLNQAEIRLLGIPEFYVRGEVAAQQEEIVRLQARYRAGKPLPDPRGKAVILVDDGIATGYTMRAAVESVRSREPARLVVAVPVGPCEAVNAMRRLADTVVCLASPEPFFAVGSFYLDFSQVSDETVERCLADAAARVTPELPGS